MTMILQEAKLYKAKPQAEHLLKTKAELLTKPKVFIAIVSILGLLFALVIWSTLSSIGFLKAQLFAYVLIGLMALIFGVLIFSGIWLLRRGQTRIAEAKYYWLQATVLAKVEIMMPRSTELSLYLGGRRFFYNHVPDLGKRLRIGQRISLLLVDSSENLMNALILADCLPDQEPSDSKGELLSTWLEESPEMLANLWALPQIQTTYRLFRDKAQEPEKPQSLTQLVEVLSRKSA